MGSNLQFELVVMGTYRYNMFSLQIGLISIMSLQLQSNSENKVLKINQLSGTVK